MSRFFDKELILKTHKPGHRDEGGRWVEGEPDLIPFKGSVQPAKGKELEILPDGKRNRETIKILTYPDLKFTVAEPREQRSGDIIIWKGKEYEVMVASPWEGPTKPHWELLATIKTEGAA